MDIGELLDIAAESDEFRHETKAQPGIFGFVAANAPKPRDFIRRYVPP